MELAIGMFAAMGMGGAAAGGAAAAGTAAAGAAAAGTAAAGTVAAGGAAAGAASFGATALSVLSGVMTVGSVLTTLMAGGAKASEQKSNAMLAEVEARQELIASEEAALRIKRDLLAKVGAARVAFAGSGLTIGSAAAIENDLENQAAFETSIERSNARLRRAHALARARQHREGASASLIGAAGSALGQAASFGIDLANRG